MSDNPLVAALASLQAPDGGGCEENEEDGGQCEADGEDEGECELLALCLLLNSNGDLEAGSLKAEQAAVGGIRLAGVHGQPWQIKAAECAVDCAIKPDPVCCCGYFRRRNS